MTREQRIRELKFNLNPCSYTQLGPDLQNVKQLLGLKHVTISNFANKIFVYETIATTLHNHILYTANVNQYIVQNGCHSFFLIS